MGYNTTTEARTQIGDLHATVLTYDITTDGSLTGLSNAGYEAIDLAADAGLDAAFGAFVIGQENGGYLFSYDHVNGDRLSAKYADYDAASDGVLINVPSGTDVGEVRVFVFGVR